MGITMFYNIKKVRIRYEPYLDKFLLYKQGYFRPRVINRISSIIILKLHEGFSDAQIIDYLCNIYSSESVHKIKRDTISFINSLIDDEIISLDSTAQRESFLKFNKDSLSLNKYNGAFSIPDRVQIELTSMCNLRCRHCYIPGTETSDTPFSYKELLKLIDYLDSWGIDVIQLTGGEPFLYPRIKDLIEYIDSKYIGIQIFTNGTLINDWLISDYVAKITEYIISIDGNERYHDSFRGINGDYRKTYENVKQLLRLNAKIKISYSLNMENYKYLYDTYNIFKELGVQSFVCSPPVPIGKSKENKLSYSDYIFLLSYASEFYKTTNVSRTNSVIEEQGYNLPPEFSCSAGKKLLYISSSGGIYSCPFFSTEEFKLGNIYKNDLKECWEKNKILQRFRLIKTTNYEECKNCSSCKIWCRALNYYTTGTLEGISAFCEKGKD